LLAMQVNMPSSSVGKHAEPATATAACGCCKLIKHTAHCKACNCCCWLPYKLLLLTLCMNSFFLPTFRPPTSRVLPGLLVSDVCRYSRWSELRSRQMSVMGARKPCKRTRQRPQVRNITQLLHQRWDSMMAAGRGSSFRTTGLLMLLCRPSRQAP
jgi:hypothetical protein